MSIIFYVHSLLQQTVLHCCIVICVINIHFTIIRLHGMFVFRCYTIIYIILVLLICCYNLLKESLPLVWTLQQTQKKREWGLQWWSTVAMRQWGNVLISGLNWVELRLKYSWEQTNGQQSQSQTWSHYYYDYYPLRSEYYPKITLWQTDRQSDRQTATHCKVELTFSVHIIVIQSFNSIIYDCINPLNREKEQNYSRRQTYCHAMWQKTQTCAVPNWTQYDGVALWNADVYYNDYTVHTQYINRTERCCCYCYFYSHLKRRWHKNH